MNKLKRFSESALELAKENGFSDVMQYTSWNDYIVFQAINQRKSDVSDLPEHLPLILVKKSEIRWANADEADEITILFV
ncbi:MAG: hypothetical protein LBH12_04405 [Dysgonamonadaceae bacterium]|jgi:16S rRNA C1402 N4-methylase RsmH|nr:hypothetical protein [Dysgonamonadaceae bacterium]